MAWGIRRSARFGPFRLNLSKSGIGWSVGVRGARIGKDARGRTYTNVSIPGTGIYNRQYDKPSQLQRSQPAAATAPTKVCPRCGSRWAQAAEYCTNCGVRLQPLSTAHGSSLIVLAIIVVVVILLIGAIK
jgi:hypothetical protein